MLTILTSMLCIGVDANTIYIENDTDYQESTQTIESSKPGDVNGDNKVNVTDFTAIANYILGNPPANFNMEAADVNSDNNIDATDLTAVANIILYGLPYRPTVIISNGGKEKKVNDATLSPYIENINFNDVLSFKDREGKVPGSDFKIFINHYGIEVGINKQAQYYTYQTVIDAQNIVKTAANALGGVPSDQYTCGKNQTEEQFIAEIVANAVKAKEKDPDCSDDTWYAQVIADDATTDKDKLTTLANALVGYDEAVIVAKANARLYLLKMCRTDVAFTKPNRQKLTDSEDIEELPTIYEVDPTLSLEVDFSDSNIGQDINGNVTGGFRFIIWRLNDNTNSPFHIYLPLEVKYSYANEEPDTPITVWAIITFKLTEANTTN